MIDNSTGTTCADCGGPFTSPMQQHAVTDDGRRICYACAAEHERLAMIATGRAGLYLSKETNVDGSYFLAGDARRGYAYDYRLTNWSGEASFRIIGRVRESHGYGFGRRYDVRTFRFAGPDGYVWSGRNAGDMQLARCKRTKERA